MPFPLRLITEQERLQRIAQTGVLVTEIPAFVRDLLEELTVLFGAKICFMTIVGELFQHIVARVGFDLKITDRDHAFCAYTILTDEVMVVYDAKLDERFANNPYVINAPYIRFYAGAPLITIDGHRLGSICLIGDTPRDFSKSERAQLAQAAKTVSMRLGFLERTDELSQFTSEDLARMIRMQICSNETPLMMKLVQTLYFRLRIASL